MQAVLPNWPRQLPPGLTQLVLAPLNVHHEYFLDYAGEGYTFVCGHLRPLRELHHLAFHGMTAIGEHALLMKEICDAAVALPHLISLHLVRTPYPSLLCVVVALRGGSCA